jgi:hypothetical protein
MKTILTCAVAGALMLTGCTTTGTDGAIQSSLPKTCALIDTAHTAFLLVAASGKISEKTVIKEQAGYDAVQGICEDPENVTAADALIAAARAYLVISTALKAAKEVE